jgi:hypothetical protein
VFRIWGSVFRGFRVLGLRVLASGKVVFGMRVEGLRFGDEVLVVWVLGSGSLCF